MKITCNREQLLAAFQIAATVAPSRSPKAILQNVRLDASDEGAILMATDLEVGIRISVSGIEVEEPGSAVLSVARFGPILRESSDERLAIETDTSGATVRGAHSRFTLPTENPEEFPSVIEFSETKFHKIEAKAFKELVRRTLFATDTDSSRYALGGVLLEFEQDKMIAVGTDGRRLAKMEAPATSIGGHLTGEATTIVPTRSMQLIDRALADIDSDIEVAARPNDVIVRTQRATIFSRLVEGRFPNWRDVFPTRQNAVQIDLLAGPLFSAHRQAAIVTSDDSRGIHFEFGKGNLVLSGSTADVGQSRIDMPIPYQGEVIKVTMDHRFVSDFLKVLDAQKVFTIEIEDGEAAALFTTDDGYGYVVMPLAREE